MDQETTFTAPENRQHQVERRTDGRFVRGVSGNPGGRPRVLANVQAMAREHTAEAIGTYYEIMTDRHAPAVARVAAANCLMNRAWGTPQSSIMIAQQPRGEEPSVLRDALVQMGLELHERLSQSSQCRSEMELVELKDLPD